MGRFAETPYYHRLGRPASCPARHAPGSLVFARVVLALLAVMPPPSTKKSLTAEQKTVFKQWITAGAEYQPHWAFVAPRQVPQPHLADRARPRSPLDAYVQAVLERAKLTPAPEADRYALIRRAYLDLLGEPPTPHEADVEQYAGRRGATRRAIRLNCDRSCDSELG